MTSSPRPSGSPRRTGMRIAYAVLAVAGTLLPLSQFMPWIAAHGLALPLVLQQAFGSPVAAFAWLDVLVSGCVLLVFMWSEARRLKMAAPWWPVAGLLLVGMSLALPWFLYLRETHLARTSN
jgi:hypothetical protein